MEIMQESTTSHGRSRRRGLLALLMVGATFISLTGGMLSLAIFTDQQQVTGNDFTAGTIDISVAPATALLSATTLMPGDTVNGSAVVTNAGTAQLRYAITGIATNADGLGLASQMTVTIRELGTSCAAFDGTQLYSGTVPYATGNLVGDPAQGADAGDRTLNAGVSETLCFRATLPLATGDAYQGAATTMTFTFAAEQTANN
jgi:predicted ribosomally synthesized peptide with SipW-like signal peptide